MPTEPNPDRKRHEPASVHVPLLLAAGAGVVVLVAIAFFGARGLFGWRTASQPDRVPRGVTVPADTTGGPFPALQIRPAAAMRHFRRWEEAELGSWAWIDSTERFARIPLGRAMAIVEERGLPDWSAGRDSVRALDIMRNRAEAP